ncbi:capsid maturation protease [Microbacterium phage Coltrane]|uniref:Capsid maturation protease n=6 Tax=Armstrongvirus armstrong TaxID=2734217 RepID=A0A3G2KD13_9CAUD|nr:head maturation protease [Microbacterium phage Armstrong]AYN55877.1 capsid maturation protease [Microbacterium phage Brahms]AYN56983.1 capsid maturation protease [Microbacterium phage Bernstein]AYN57342.1 capsid maturation protease [Microbacterium phage Coltrane]AYN58930.1 capsid maturation protease [Microbacterium phage Rollins]QED11427.1 capsid maturation protease [Microbacterium phage Vitas]UGL61971.1 capsid maturation protease [Microbacterium phage Skylord]UOK18157.1 capsid maturation
MDLKSVRLTGIKTAGDAGSDLAEGEFLAYASTWTREPDSYGDVVAKGAFADSIEEWTKSDSVLPILFGHDLVDPFSNLGYAKSMVEDDHGLLVHAVLDLENPKAKQVYRMLKGRRINQMSFAFDVLEDGIVDLGDEKTARELRKMKLHEVSVVPFGANSDTEVLAVKALEQSLELKAGKTISAKNLASLEAAYASLGEVIKAAKGEADDTDAEASSDEKAGDEGQEAKSRAARSRSALAKMSFLLS